VDRVTHVGRLSHDARTGYLRALLDALNISADSQLLVFSRTGVQHAYTGPRTPRALYFDESIAVGYVPGAPQIEIIARDPVEGLAFYTIDQNTAVPTPVRQHSCLGCHESASTRDVPGFIVRSHGVDDQGNVLPEPAAHDVNHQTPHPDRWGGWFVTLEGLPAPYSQRGHQGNITFTPQGHTSSQVFVDWTDSAPATRGYLSGSSDIMALLAFDHQMPAINLMTRLDFQWRRGSGAGHASVDDPAVRDLVDELAGYLLFANEAALPVPLKPLPGFASALAARVPKDSRGRSLAQLDGVNRLLRYPCSYMVYSEAFDGLPAPIKQAVYQRMIEILPAAQRVAILEILRDTKPDFPRGPL